MAALPESWCSWRHVSSQFQWRCGRPSCGSWRQWRCLVVLQRRWPDCGESTGVSKAFSFWWPHTSALILRQHGRSSVTQRRLTRSSEGPPSHRASLRATRWHARFVHILVQLPKYVGGKETFLDTTAVIWLRGSNARFDANWSCYGRKHQHRVACFKRNSDIGSNYQGIS